MRARSMAGSDRLRAAVAADEAGVLSHQLGRLSDAERVLSETLEQVRDPERARSPRRRTGRDRRERRLRDDRWIRNRLTDAVPTAALAAVIESAAAGRLDLAVRIASEQLATAPQWTDEFPKVELYLHLARTWALLLNGDLADAQVEPTPDTRTPLEEGAEFPRVTWSLLRGMILVAQGRPHTAMRALLEAAARFEVADRGFLRPSHAYLAMAAALVGDVAASEQHLRAATTRKPSFDGVFGVDVARAGAWLVAARG